jgi:hypothetical protein
MALALLLGIIINADVVLILQTDQITWLLKCISLGDLSRDSQNLIRLLLSLDFRVSIDGNILTC